MCKTTDYADLLVAVGGGKPEHADTFHVAAWLHNLRWHRDPRVRGRRELAADVVERRLGEMRDAGWLRLEDGHWLTCEGGHS